MPVRRSDGAGVAEKYHSLLEERRMCGRVTALVARRAVQVSRFWRRSPDSGAGLLILAQVSMFPVQVSMILAQVSMVLVQVSMVLA